MSSYVHNLEYWNGFKVSRKNYFTLQNILANFPVIQMNTLNATLRVYADISLNFHNTCTFPRWITKLLGCKPTYFNVKWNTPTLGNSCACSIVTFVLRHVIYTENKIGPAERLLMRTFNFGL